MSSRFLLFSFHFLFVLLFVNTRSSAQSSTDEKHIEVAMRMIGHQILLNNEDSLSRVLPIKKEEERYKIEFESKFEFIPDELAATIDSVMESNAIARNYLVEVESCDSNLVVYNYEVSDSAAFGIIPCKARGQNFGCYSIFISILDKDKLIPPNPVEKSYSSLAVILPLLLLIGVFFYLRARWRITNSNVNLIRLGDYKFDKRNMKLSHADANIELSSKESDLLYLLYSSANTTLERDHILKIVWGDEGDYVGRTLDVFISKLRKKLEADARLKIVNVRGVGYKLVLNN